MRRAAVRQRPASFGRGGVRRDDGYAALELALGVGLIVFPVALLVITLPTWSERQSVAREAAQEAARAVVVADSADAGWHEAEEVVARVALGYGLDPGDLVLRRPADPSLQPGQAVTAEVVVRIPATVFPGLGSVGSLHWTARHTEVVDLYRGF